MWRFTVLTDITRVLKKKNSKKPKEDRKGKLEEQTLEGTKKRQIIKG